jgi:YVTN family beta-propeller protein
MRFTGKHGSLALVLILGWTTAGLSQAGKPDSKPIPAPPPITLPLASLTPDATIELGGDRRITVTPDAVWVASRATGNLIRIDPKTNVPDKPIPIGKEPCHSLVQAFKSLWTSAVRSGFARPIRSAGRCSSKDAPAEKPADKPADASGAKKPKDPITLITTAVHGAGPIVSATGSVWMVTNGGASLVRVDPDTNTVVAEVSLPAAATAIAVSGDALWLVSSAKNVALRVNGYSNVVEETVKVGPSPIAIASGEGSVWTLNGGDGSLSRIDPKTNKVTETIKAGITASNGAILVGEGSVWVSTPGSPLARIDPRTNTLAQRFTGPGGGVFALGLKSIWLAATPTHIWRIDPKRVEATRKQNRPQDVGAVAAMPNRSEASRQRIQQPAGGLALSLTHGLRVLGFSGSRGPRVLGPSGRSRCSLGSSGNNCSSSSAP